MSPAVPSAVPGTGAKTKAAGNPVVTGGGGAPGGSLASIWRRGGGGGQTRLGAGFGPWTLPWTRALDGPKPACSVDTSHNHRQQPKCITSFQSLYNHQLFLFIRFYLDFYNSF